MVLVDKQGAYDGGRYLFDIARKTLGNGNRYPEIAVKVRALLLEPTIFDTVPVYFLTTDVPENSEEDRKLTDKLYDAEQRTRISQEIILGIDQKGVVTSQFRRNDLNAAADRL